MIDRQKQLLKHMLKHTNQIYTINELQEIVHCSEKTVRTDLEAISQSLVDYEEAELIRKRGIGVSLQISDTDKMKLYESLYEVSTKTNEERIIEIAYRLLTSKEPITLKQLAERYFTHTQEIKKDLDAINHWFARFELAISTKQRAGSIVIGEEFHKRAALAHLSELVLKNDTRDHVLYFFEEYEITLVKQLLLRLDDQYQLELTDEKLESLLIHALIMIKRTKQKTTIQIKSEDIQSTLHSPEFDITDQLIQRLENSLRMTFPLDEKVYYSWHLSSATPKLNTIQPFNEQTEEIIKKLIEKVQYFTKMPFQQDSILLDGLKIHMNAAIKRISYGFHIANPMLHDIKKLYPYLFNMIVFALTDLQKEYPLHVPEEETAYLVIHFQAAIERMDKQQPLKRALIVCHMGIGISRLLEAKITQQYKGIEIVDCIAKNELSRFLKKHQTIDYIISTVSLENIQLPHIVITPFLNAEDKQKLNKFIQGADEHQLTSDYLALKQFIKEGLFQFNLHVDHPFKVVERMANQLVLLGLVEESFTHQAVVRERESFTAIGGGIAIPHAHPSLVKTSTVSIAILKQPMEWGNEFVSIVFLLAITEQDRHVTKDLLKDLSNVSNQPQLIEKLKQTQTKDEMIKILNGI